MILLGGRGVYRRFGPCYAGCAGHEEVDLAPTKIAHGRGHFRSLISREMRRRFKLIKKSPKLSLKERKGQSLRATAIQLTATSRSVGGQFWPPRPDRLGGIKLRVQWYFLMAPSISISQPVQVPNRVKWPLCLTSRASRLTTLRFPHQEPREP